MTLTWLRSNALGLLTLAVVIAGSALYVQQAAALNAATECQNAYNQAVAQALDIRSVSAARERQRNEELVETELATWREVLTQRGNTEPTPEQRAASVAIFQRYLKHGDAYLAASRAAGTVRENNPLPDLDCS